MIDQRLLVALVGAAICRCCYAVSLHLAQEACAAQLRRSKVLAERGNLLLALAVVEKASVPDRAWLALQWLLVWSVGVAIAYCWL